MKAKLSAIHCWDDELHGEYTPDDVHNFGVFIQLFVSSNTVTAIDETFVLTVCSTSYLKEKLKGEPIFLPRHHLLMDTYDFQKLYSYIETYCDSCVGETWSEVALKVGRLGMWEFEDYIE